jgi:hypothetical protein
MRLVASFADDRTAGKVHADLLRLLEAIFARAERFTCAAFGQSFETKEKFAEWKKEHWDPIVDERCKLEVERKPDGKVHVWGDYALILDDWARDEVGVALDGALVALRTYTAGYGIEYLEKWLSERGGKVDVQVEGEEYEFVPLEGALETVQAPADAAGSGGVRATDGDGNSAGPEGDGGLPGASDPV